MTQYDLIKQYIQDNGFIIPAKVCGREYGDEFFGSETPKRCRELRKADQLDSEPEGKFEKFFFKRNPVQPNLI